MKHICREKTRSKASQIEENVVLEIVGHQGVSVTRNVTKTVLSGDFVLVGSISTHNAEVAVGWAWKPAPSIKAKLDEQRYAQTKTLVSDVVASVNSLSLATPWVGVYHIHTWLRYLVKITRETLQNILLILKLLKV